MCPVRIRLYVILYSLKHRSLIDLFIFNAV
nr:MAG TPA: hypothetical protein [Caudoviricetes sp.]